MARKPKTKPDQEMLIDVQPENSKAIIAAACSYQKYQKARIAALAEEIKYKQKILELVKAANLQPLEGGIIRF